MFSRKQGWRLTETPHSRLKYGLFQRIAEETIFHANRLLTLPLIWRATLAPECRVCASVAKGEVTSPKL